MMKTRDWKDGAELIGIAAIVASLIFVGMQLRQDQNIAITETRSAITESVGTIATLIQADRETWKRGVDGEELSAEDQIAFLAMTRAVENHFFNLTLRYRRFGNQDPERVERRFAFVLYIHSGLRQAYFQNIEFRKAVVAAFGQPWESRSLFHNSIQAKLHELDQNSPVVPPEIGYVFW